MQDSLQFYSSQRSLEFRLVNTDEEQCVFRVEDNGPIKRFDIIGLFYGCCRLPSKTEQHFFLQMQSLRYRYVQKNPPDKIAKPDNKGKWISKL